jgi:hypothetical protein
VSIYPLLVEALEAHAPQTLGSGRCFDATTGEPCCAIGVLLAYVAPDLPPTVLARLDGQIPAGESVARATALLDAEYAEVSRTQDANDIDDDTDAQRYARMLAWAKEQA